MTGRVLLAALLAGWLADRLARPDRDVEAGIEAYEAGDLSVALERFEAAIARHGDRPELSLNRGLVLLAQGAAKGSDTDAARRAFERASESDDPEVRASAFYERGNVALDAESWDAAIEAYVECLKARPDHANAKWNLELARQRKQAQEKEKEDEQDEQEQDETGGEDSGGSDETGGTTGDETGGSEESGGDTGGSGESGGETGGSGESGGGSGGSGESGQPPEQGGSSGGQDGSDRPEEQDDGQPPPPQPAPLDQMDIEKALEELDQQDHFLLDRPAGGVRPPTEDW